MKTSGWVLASVLAVAVCGATGQAQTGKIVYKDGNSDLRVFYLPSGPDAALVTTAKRSELHPRLTRDGTKLAFTVSGKSASGIRARSFSSTAETAVTTDAWASWPSWSADGQWIAYTSGAGKTKGLWVARQSGSMWITTRLTTIEAGYAVWSPLLTPVLAPDGTQLLVTQIAFSSNGDIWIMDVIFNTVRQQFSASNVMPLLAPYLGNDGDLDWQPSGFITFTHYTGVQGLSHDIYAVNPSTLAVSLLISLPEFDIESRWSPDATMLVFRRSDGLWLANASGLNQIIGTGPTIPGGGQCTWSQ